MKYGSVCSGIEAATVAWHSLSFEPTWFSEIEEVPSLILKHHYPSVPNLGDMTLIRDKVKTGEVEAPEILVGGTPCQAFSMAGLRNSLDDERGQLSLEFVRLADEIDSARFIQKQQPCIIVWENVPGVLNTKDNAFGCFLGELSGAGCELQPSGRKWPNAGCVLGPSRQVYWRVLDAQHFGLAQRRKRVFVVASARAECIGEILFERKSMPRNLKKGDSTRKSSTRNCRVYTQRASETLSGKTFTPPILASHGQKKWLGNQEAFCGDYYIKHAVGIGGITANAAISNEVFPTLLARHGDVYVILSYGLNGNTIGHLGNSGSRGTGINTELSYTLVSTKKNAVVYCGTKNDALFDIAKEIAPTVRCGGKYGGAIHQPIFKYIPPNIYYLARYLTEVECERLQGFPDNYTNVKGVASGKRYKALGNSMAVSVMKWIGSRIQKNYNQTKNTEYSNG
ncbi:putative BsuMI modification methylase subunit YdiP [Acinetobacter calcoaceticus]|uniref:DNA (cytosine-5-)-methyltransferase n=1 Tax=Acinetobacter calcoaceticus TaxID=471 RepID=A0A446ZIN4_ACICA|nr:DNA cytosine methyltransferase [Acinetobacter calcoaceticus]VAX44326.1 putative BsuMI modification methylase subunit YdiP [Acinetobacter calcoaceticus]